MVKDDGGAVSTRTKFELAMWKFMVFTICVVVGLYTLLPESWLLDPPMYFEHVPNMPFK